MGHELIGDGFIKRAGWLQYAASNDLILLMPQMEVWWTNPFGTWDANVPYRWQYTEDYFREEEDPLLFNTNQGVQPKAIKAMIDRLTQPIDSQIDYAKYNEAEDGYIGRAWWWYIWEFPYFMFLVFGCFSPYGGCDL